MCIVVHISNETEHGHYTALVHHKTRGWKYVDDSSVTDVVDYNAKFNILSSPYLLLYGRHDIEFDDKIEGIDNLGSTCFSNAVIQMLRVVYNAKTVS